MNKFISMVSAAAITLSLIPASFFLSSQAALADSGLNYNESTDIISDSCDSGYTSSLWIKCEPGKNWTTSVTHYSLLLIGIGGYSSAMNKNGTDYDLDEAFFQGLEGTLSSARANGVTVGLRFRYDDNGSSNPEPDSFDKVLDHISQIGESGLLEKYSDVISFVETGFVGSWGEQWGGKYTDLPSKAIVLDRFLSIVPDPTPVLVRTPNTFRQWLSDFCGISTSAKDMSYSISDPELAAKASRVGLYNDGYMGSDSDLGTYSDRTGETAWLSSAPSYGGEFSGSDEWRLKYTTWQPEFALKEMYYTNLLRINSNIYKTKTASASFDSQADAQAKLDSIAKLYSDCGLAYYDFGGTITQENDKYTASWKWIGYDDFTFDADLDSKLGVSCDNSAFYGQDVWTFIRAHLGYRFVLRSCKLTDTAAPGDKLDLDFTVENTGFSEAPRSKETEILLSDGKTVYTFTTDINAANWLSASTDHESLSIDLPETLHGGEWKVYLRISDPNPDAKYDTHFAAKFANADLQFNDTLKANLLGSISITGEADPEEPDVSDERPAGVYLSEEPVPITETEKAELLPSPYKFTEDGHYGFTFVYRIDGTSSPISIGDWYAGFTVDGNNYGSAYTTYGINTRNQEMKVIFY